MAYNILESDGMLEVCIRYFNPPSLKAPSELGFSRYEIQVEYESVNGSASEYVHKTYMDSVC